MLSTALSVVCHLAVVGLLANPFAWALGAVVLLAAGFYLAPTQTLVIVTNSRTWLIAGVIAVAVCFAHVEVKNEGLKAANAILTQQNKDLSTQVGVLTGAQAAVTQKSQAQAVNQVQTNKLHTTASNAPQGTKEDAVLDAIAQDDTQSASVSPQPAPAAAGDSDPTDRVLDGIAASAHR